jgi:glyoxylase-like metal-dependent hydrolase (beta-lactamase superfamily II)
MIAFGNPGGKSMRSTHLNTFCRKPISTPIFFMTPVVFAFLWLAGLCSSGLPAAAQASPPPGATVRKVADDVYFFFDFSGSNAVFLVTEEGVLVIDTRTHPREGRDLLERIRKVTDKPIKWVINSHAIDAKLAPWL